MTGKETLETLARTVAQVAAELDTLAAEQLGADAISPLYAQSQRATAQKCAKIAEGITDSRSQILALSKTWREPDQP